MELTPELLTDAEERRLRAAVAEGKILDGEVPSWAKEERATLGRQLKKLLAVWEALDDTARVMVTGDLAARTGADDVDKADLGVAVRERLDLIRYRKAPSVPGLFEAVEALVAIWAGRQFKTGGNHHRAQTEGKPDHPMLIFIAQHVLGLFPETGDHAKQDGQRLNNAVRRVESQLKESRARREYR